MPRLKNYTKAIVHRYVLRSESSSSVVKILIDLFQQCVAGRCFLMELSQQGKYDTEINRRLNHFIMIERLLKDRLCMVELVERCAWMTAASNSVATESGLG